MKPRRDDATRRGAKMAHRWKQVKTAADYTPVTEAPACSPIMEPPPWGMNATGTMANFNLRPLCTFSPPT